MIIAIIGPDGSGKTTVALALVEALQLAGYSARHYPFNFGILPKLSAFRRNGRKQTCRTDAGPVMNLRVNSKLASLAYVSWYGIDYFLGGVALRLAGIFSRRPKVSVFARYFYDYYYQSNNQALPVWVKKLVERTLVPKPECIIFLDRDAEEIFGMKPELPVEEIKRQQATILARFGRYPHFHVIDGRNGIQQTVASAMRAICLAGGVRQHG